MIPQLDGSFKHTLQLAALGVCLGVVSNLLSSFGTKFCMAAEGFFDNIRVMMDIHRALSIIVEWEELMLCIVFLLSGCLQSSPLQDCRDTAASTYLVKKNAAGRTAPQEHLDSCFRKDEYAPEGEFGGPIVAVAMSVLGQDCVPACRSRDVCVWCDCGKIPPSTD